MLLRDLVNQSLLEKKERRRRRTVAFLDPEAVAAVAFYGRHRGKYLFSTSQSAVWERTGSKKKYFEEEGGAQSWPQEEEETI